jgi:RNA polymerase sigma-70 factor (ECF subfamily)
VDHYRQRKNIDEHDDGYIDNDQSTEDSADRRITNVYLRSILRRLTRDQQQVIMLKFFEDMGNESIAELLGKPIGAVKSLQHRALRRLQQLIEDEEYL